jgi:HD-GYP domain-containing protein (c-di-GMP phosphodiesterase class II)
MAGAQTYDRSRGGVGVRSGEIFAALSLATDHGTGQAFEHGLRTCLIAVGLAEAAGIEGDELEDVFYLGLLHSIGCTADAPEAGRLFGDDRAPRAAYTLINPGRPAEMMGYLWRNVHPDVAAPRRVRAFAGAVAAGPAGARASIRSHCEVAERLAERLSLSPRLREGLWFVLERWDGNGMPRGIGGERIPVAARILHAARDASAFHAVGGVELVEAMAERSAGAGLEPSIAGMLRANASELFGRLSAEDAWEQVVALEPRPRVFMGESLDQVCLVIGDHADLMSYGTRGHARRTAEVAEAAGWRTGLGADTVALLRRAALLHDLGRVAVSSAVWGKPGPLTRGESEQVRLHSYQTERLLARIQGFADVVAVAAADHERLDGSGYHRALGATQLTVPARVLAAADVFCALREPRPYRPALAAADAAAVLRGEATGGRLCAEAVDAVLESVGERGEPVAAPPAGLSGREVQVLRLLARGFTNKQAAAELGISPKTVGRHVEAIYSKIGASTRAAAALFAMEHDLLRP